MNTVQLGYCVGGGVGCVPGTDTELMINCCQALSEFLHTHRQGKKYQKLARILDAAPTNPLMTVP